MVAVPPSRAPGWAAAQAVRAVRSSSTSVGLSMRMLTRRQTWSPLRHATYRSPPQPVAARVRDRVVRGLEHEPQHELAEHAAVDDLAFGLGRHASAGRLALQVALGVQHLL